MDADIGGSPSTGVGGLEKNSVGDARFRGDVPNFDVMETARSLAANGDGGCSLVDD